MALALPQLTLLPNLRNMLASLFQVTGLKDLGDLFQRADTLLKGQDVSAVEISAFTSDINVVLSGVGEFVPGGGFAGLKDEITKYEAIVSAVLSGQTQKLTDVKYTDPQGNTVELDLLLAVKTAPAAEAAPVAA